MTTQDERSADPGRPDGSDGDVTDPAETPDDAGPADDRRPRKRRGLRLWQETALLLALALVLALVIKTFFLQAFYIPSESMEPGLVENDRILVQKVSYWGGSGPERGDVVVFADPGGWLGTTAAQPEQNALTSVMARIGLYPTDGHLVKRVIGVAGDTIECCERGTGRLMVNGEPVDETGYTRRGSTPQCAAPWQGSAQGACSWSVGPVPEGEMFVLGDNRNASADSRAQLCPADATDCTEGREFVPTDLVVGKVFVVVWPRESFRWVEQPDAFADVPAGS